VLVSGYARLLDPDDVRLADGVLEKPFDILGVCQLADRARAWSQQR
jgi:hypothetical protein